MEVDEVAERENLAGANTNKNDRVPFFGLPCLSLMDFKMYHWRRFQKI